MLVVVCLFSFVRMEGGGEEGVGREKERRRKHICDLSKWAKAL